MLAGPIVQRLHWHTHVVRGRDAALRCYVPRMPRNGASGAYASVTPAIR
jgi:hypothetical protein